jgi:two-component system OmpR family sensor kinase
VAREAAAPLSRLPVRVRVTLAFAGVMAVVLAATGLFVYLRLASELDATIDQGLRSRAGDVAALIEHTDTALAASGRLPLTERGENLAQVLDAGGRVVDATLAVKRDPLLSAAERRRALRSTLTVDRARLTPGGEPARLLATPVRARDRQVVVVVGAFLDDRRDALRSLAKLLSIGGAAALLLASLAGYGVAAAALRPVERMRRRAAGIQSAEPGARLPVPATRDEIGRLGETLNAMLERLEAAFERERTFVSDASHELRTPLSILKAELELALREGRTREQLTEALRSAADETDRLVQLAEDLLVIARADQGRLPIRRERFAARELLETVAERHARGAPALELRAEAGLELEADRGQLEQALGNLVDNALRYGGGTIELVAEPDGERLRLRVRDEGDGFPTGFAEVAFERFTRVDAARSRGGAGLGLAIVSAVAEAHGGAAGAANRPEGGADVWIAVPRGLRGRGAPRSPAVAAPAASPLPPHRPPPP